MASEEIAEFDRGEQDGRTPRAAADEFGADGHAVTQALSPWMYLECRTCRQTFRRGDRVVRDRATGEVGHVDPALRCAVVPAKTDTVTAAGEADTLRFTNGLLDAWPTAGRVPVTVLAADAVQVPRRAGGHRRPLLCQGCGHTFRVGESVVVCLCRPQRPGSCITAIHRDPGAGLTCWETTHPTGSVDVCPWQLTRVPP